MLSRRLLALTGALVLVLATGTAAVADPPDCPPDDPNCSIWDGGGSGNPGGGSGNPGGGSGNPGGGGGPRECKRGDEPVPCYDPLVGWFNSGDGCYYKLAEPQPSGGPAGQSAYVRTCGNASDVQWLADPPGGFEQRASPQELAFQALAKIRMSAPDIRMAPDPDGAGLVGLPVWMWTARTGSTWGTRQASASDGPISVSLTARAVKIVWDMGDGTKVPCTTPGTPYRPAYGAESSPDCGHTYTKPSRARPGGQYRITATTFWDITWAGGGESGSLNREFSSETTIRIDELQVVTR